MAKFCSSCGAKLDKGTGLCPRCDKALISDARSQRKKRMKRVRFYALMVSFVFLFFLLFMMYDPAPEPLPQPEADTALSAATGCAWKHQPGDPEVTQDMVTASVITTVRCTACGEVISQSTEKMETFLDGEQFTLTPEQFKDRMIAIVRDNAPNTSRVVCKEGAAEDSAAQNALLVYRILYDDEDICEFRCYDNTGSLINVSKKDSEPVCSVTFCVPYTREDSFATAQNMLNAMMGACDPLLSEQEREAFVLRGAQWIEDCSADGWTSFLGAKNGILYLMDRVTAQNGSPYIYGSAYATTDFSKLNPSGAAVYNAVQEPPAETPVYSAEEAERLLTGTWVSKSILFYTAGESYRMDVDGSAADRITLTFLDDHHAELNMEAFSLDSAFHSSLVDFWNGRNIHWEYLYDTGNALCYLMETPGMRMSVPYCYDLTSTSNRLLSVWLSDSVSVLLAKE